MPVLSYQHLRSSTKAYREASERIDARTVTLRLVSVSRRVTQMSVPLDFYQEEAAEGNWLPTTYSVYFADAAGAPVIVARHSVCSARRSICGHRAMTALLATASSSRTKADACRSGASSSRLMSRGWRRSSSFEEGQCCGIKG